MLLSRSSYLFPKTSLKVNRGAIYIAASRAMSSDLGSGAGKGGGSGGRLVNNVHFL